MFDYQIFPFQVVRSRHTDVHNRSPPGSAHYANAKSVIGWLYTTCYVILMSQTNNVSFHHHLIWLYYHVILCSNDVTSFRRHSISVSYSVLDRNLFKNGKFRKCLGFTPWFYCIGKALLEFYENIKNAITYRMFIRKIEVFVHFIVRKCKYCWEHSVYVKRLRGN